MDVYIYDSRETDFSHNGLGTLCPQSVLIQETINGEYALTMIHPVDDAGKWAKIRKRNIIKAKGPNGYQLFIIHTITKTAGSITVSARHIFYKLLDNFIEDVYPTQKTGQQAIDAILGGAQFPSGFTGTSDITIRQNARLVRQSPVAALIGTEDNSFINRWGGEIKRDNFTFSINERIGSDKGMTIKYGKNLLGLTAEEDYTNMATRIMPTGLTSENSVVILPEKYIDSPRIDVDNPIIRHVHFSEIQVGREVDGEIPYPTVDSVYAALREKVAALYAAGADKPTVTIEAQMVDLSQTEEYKDYSVLQTVELGDTIKVDYEPLEILYELRLASYSYDALNDYYVDLLIGDQPVNIGQSINDLDIDLSILDGRVNNAVMQGEQYNNVYITHSDGFVAEATINNKNVKVSMNAYNPLSVQVAGKTAGGILLNGSDVIFAAGRLTTPDNQNWYGIVGKGPEANDGGGFFLVDSASYPTSETAYFKVWPTTYTDGVNGTVLRSVLDAIDLYTKNYNILHAAPDGTYLKLNNKDVFTAHKDGTGLSYNGNWTFFSGNNTTQILLNGKNILQATSSSTYLFFPGSSGSQVYLELNSSGARVVKNDTVIWSAT